MMISSIIAAAGLLMTVGFFVFSVIVSSNFPQHKSVAKWFDVLSQSGIGLLAIAFVVYCIETNMV